MSAIDGPEVTGTLARDVAMRLVDISRTGCLLESRQRVEVGTVGELQLQVQRETFVDDVRVTRCVRVEGSGSIYRVGAEFVQTRRPGEHSIRRAVTTTLRELATRSTGSTAGARDTDSAGARDTDSGSPASTGASIVNSVHSTTGEERHEKSARSVHSRG